ncbi:melatonin receptor type 1B-like isoform X1 [Ciona intestinalis]
MEADALHLTNISDSTTLDPNPWATRPLAQQVVEMVYLVIVMTVGSIGNMLVIAAIVIRKKVHVYGNIFIINLAVADLMVVMMLVPSVLSNVIANDNTLPDIPCRIIGFMMSVTCSCSIHNLTAVSVNRYWAVVRSSSYSKVFSNRNTVIFVVAIWLWSAILFVPSLPLTGKPYDPKIMECLWDDQFSRLYTVVLVVVVIMFPLITICVCYWKLYKNVRKGGVWFRKQQESTRVRQPIKKSDSHVYRREIRLLKTLAVAILAYVICWLPYGMCIIIDPINIPALPKKIFGWMAFTNSSVNFVIYGVMNPSYRRGYVEVIRKICNKPDKNHTSKGSDFSNNSFRNSTLITNFQRSTLDKAGTNKRTSLAVKCLRPSPTKVGAVSS